MRSCNGLNLGNHCEIHCSTLVIFGFELMKSITRPSKRWGWVHSNLFSMEDFIRSIKKASHADFIGCLMLHLGFIYHVTWLSSNLMPQFTYSIWFDFQTYFKRMKWLLIFVLCGTASIAGYFITADKTILECARRNTHYKPS